jgi:hypothetical protein
MTWITVKQPGPDEPELTEALAASRAGYPPEYGPARQAEKRLPEPVMADSIVMSHSLLPNVLRHVFGAHSAMMDPALPLSRRQHEMIAATVSALNTCFY